jgi:hypothetical protein
MMNTASFSSNTTLSNASVKSRIAQAVFAIMFAAFSIAIRVSDDVYLKALLP